MVDDVIYEGFLPLVKLLNKYEDTLARMEEEKGIIKDKLLNQILEYQKVSHETWAFGLSECVEGLHTEVEELFKNPNNFVVDKSHEDCANFTESNEDDTGFCKKLNKEITYMWEETDCEEFKWR